MGFDGLPVGINLFIPIGDALQKFGIVFGPGMETATYSPPATNTPLKSPAASAPTVGTDASGVREIQVAMYPAVGPVKQGGHVQPLIGKVTGVGTSGKFPFARPDGVTCDGRWATLQSQPQSGSLITKYHADLGLPASVTGMVGGLAIGACSNAATFQAEYYAVPGADIGFGAATDSDGNVYRLIF